MKTVAVVPMKLNNQRLPQKNTKSFTNGSPLCTYILNTLKEVNGIDEIYVYCSNPSICEFFPEGIKYLRRSTCLDSDSASMSDVLLAFAKDVPADIYVMTHTTAPFITVQSIEKGLRVVQEGQNDSSFAVEKMQDFIWVDGKPFNYSLEKIPRTQDLPVMYKESSGFYIYTKEVIEKYHRRIGHNPYLVEVGIIEGIDIDEYEDFCLADAVYNYYQKGDK